MTMSSKNKTAELTKSTWNNYIPHILKQIIHLKMQIYKCTHKKILTTFGNGTPEKINQLAKRLQECCK